MALSIIQSVSSGFSAEHSLKKLRLSEGEPHNDIGVQDEEVVNVSEVDKMAQIEDDQAVAEVPHADVDEFLGDLLDADQRSDKSEAELQNDNKLSLTSAVDCQKFLKLIEKRLIYTTRQTPDCLAELQLLLSSQPKTQSKITDFFSVVKHDE